MPNQSKSMKAAEPTAIDWLTGQNSQALQATLQSTAIAIRRSAEIQNGLMHFMLHRLAEDIETSRQMAFCRTPIEGLRLQMELVQRSSREWLEEGNKLMQLIAELSMDSLEPYREQARATDERVAGSVNEERNRSAT